MPYNEQPSPSSKPKSIAHRLHTERKQPAKSARNTLCEIGTHHPLPDLRSGVDGREQKRKALCETGFSRIQQHAHGNDLAICLDEGGSDGAGAPGQEGCSQCCSGAKGADGEDPGELEDDGADA